MTHCWSNRARLSRALLSCSQITLSLTVKHIYIHTLSPITCAHVKDHILYLSSEHQCWDQKNQTTLTDNFRISRSVHLQQKKGHKLSQVFHVIVFSSVFFSLRGSNTIKSIIYCVWTNDIARQWAAERRSCLSVFPIVGSSLVLWLAEQTDNGFQRRNISCISRNNTTKDKHAKKKTLKHTRRHAHSS